MDIRLRRLASDYEQVMKDFANHKNIVVKPVGDIPPEKYHVTYYVNGIYLLPDGQIETLNKHEVEITLHADYPRYKPVCTIMTPIWHPNFRDGQICIGDIWGAGESLSDIIINIGDMIQYKSWNTASPLSADAAAWAMDNRHLFPVGNIELNIAHSEADSVDVEIDLFDDDSDVTEKTDNELIETGEDPEKKENTEIRQKPEPETVSSPAGTENDFEITAEELAGIEYIPTAQRMQGAVASAGKTVRVRINFKTILVKGILWALIGAIAGFALGELSYIVFPKSTIASMLGYRYLSKYSRYSDKAEDIGKKLERKYKAYCKENDLDEEDSSSLDSFYYEADENTLKLFNDYSESRSKALDTLEEAYEKEFHSEEDELEAAIKRVTRVYTAVWSGAIALAIGLFLGLGEGIYYGSKKSALRYALIGAAISLAIGLLSGYLAQWMYSSMLTEDTEEITAALVRGLGWAIMGLGIGIAVGLIKPDPKRIIFCAIGGMLGAFLGGFAFNYVYKFISEDIASRAIGIVIMGILIGVGVGLLEQFAKSAWLKVIRGEFEGKEYLVFPGVTSIGNDSNNTIVLFKDKLVAQHHCDIIMQGSKYIIQDCGSSMGTIVNGMKTNQRILRQGDAIAIGNSILVFNTTK